MGPHIAATVPSESASQTAGAVTITAIAVTGRTTEAAAKVIAAKTITAATVTMTAATGKCAVGKPGTSENKDNCKNNYGFAQHGRLIEMLFSRIDSTTDLGQLLARKLPVDA